MATSFETGAYSAADIQQTLGGIPISGYGEGQFIGIKFDKPSAQVDQGADGYVAILTKPAGRVATATLRVAQTSLANNILNAAFNAQQITGGAALPPYQCLNSRSGEVALIANAVILDTPELVYSDGLEMREWQIAGRCAMELGGSPVL